MHAMSKSVMRIGRNILQWLIACYKAGREVDLASVIQHERMPIPISLAETNGALRFGSKALITEWVIADVPPSIDI